MKRMKKLLTIFSTLTFTLLITGCEKEENLDEGKPETNEATGKEDAWNWENDPNRFHVELIYKVAELPQSGSAQRMPWSETWWPMREDGFNHRWQGSDKLSPLEKYDRAFNGWELPEGFMDLRPFSYPGADYDEEYYEKLGPAAKWESRNGGNYMARNGIDDDGDGKIDESDDWDGLGSWWGKCHMWSAVSILAPEPKHAVEYNGVRFEYSDLTALAMIGYYNRSRAYMLGGRCNSKEVEFDEHGRPKEEECRDTNAGAFHVTVTNMLGRHRRAFVMDKAWGMEVWNHPVTDYRIDHLEEVSLDKALELLNITDSTEYPYNPDARIFYEVRLTLGYATDGVSPSTTPHGNVRYSTSYHYLLECDEEGNIIGGEWLDRDHPDFFWLPVMTNWTMRGNPYVKFANVKMLIEMSIKEQESTEPTGEEKIFENTDSIAIPDNDSEGIISVIEVPDSAPIGSLKVKVDITHTYIGDLKITLKHGDKSVVIHNREGGSQDNLNKLYHLTEFNGMNVSGSWELIISDNAKVDEGTLNSWSIAYIPGDSSEEADAHTISYNSTEPVEIPDNFPDGVDSVIMVNETGTIRGLVVKTDITHPYIGDLIVEIKHGGTSFILHNRTGGSNDDIVKEFTMSDFNGLEASGAWTLHISDNAARDVGKLNSWSIEIKIQTQ